VQLVQNERESAPAASVNNRWFHRPRLHGDTPGITRRAKPLELFFDVTAAGAMVGFSNALSQHPNLDSFAVFAMALCATWQSWTAVTFYQNRFAVDDLLHRALLLSNLVAVAVLALAAPRVLEGDTRSFSMGYAVVELVLVSLYLRIRSAIPEARKLASYYAATYAVNASVWAAAALLPKSWTSTLWLLGIGVGFSFPLNRRARELSLQRPPDPGHLAERYGFFILAVLGESFVSTLFGAVGVLDERSVASLSVALLITFCLWWLYFDDIGDSNIRRAPGATFIWVYAHAPLVIGLSITFAGVERIVHANSLAFGASTRWLVAGGLSLSLVALAMIDSVTERRQANLADRVRVNARIGSAVLVLVLPPLGLSMDPESFLGLATVPCLAQVVFDLMMAPVETRSLRGDAPSMSELVKERMVSGVPMSARRRQVPGEALRKGAPSELRQDFYSFFMEGTWSRLVLSLVFVYVVLNVFFAGLYLLDPKGIINARPGSFSDAFSFSVQTFSTIGYGAMLPGSPYANFLVTAEAASSILATALATGLMFAKAARPRSSALFSNVMILTRRNGVPALVFRVANARGNDVVDASISVTALKEEISHEGIHMRRQHDLKLLRSRTPFFTMTWVVIHEIDENSPLLGTNWEDPSDLLAVVCTLLGHDGTVSQTTYARHIYLPEDIRVGHQFIDVLSELDDGRLMIDYTKFHDTVPDDRYAPIPISARPS